MVVPLKKISINLPPPLDIAIFIAYLSRDYDEHQFSFEKPKDLLSGGMPKMKIKRISPKFIIDIDYTDECDCYLI